MADTYVQLSYSGINKQLYLQLKTVKESFLTAPSMQNNSLNTNL